MPAGAPSLLGKETIKKVSEKYFGNSSLNIAFELQNVEVDGDYAFVRARSRSIAQKATTGEKRTSMGQDFFVLHKERQQWKVCKYIFNNQNNV
jgi:ketosteroid isomerase-like protein